MMTRGEFSAVLAGLFLVVWALPAAVYAFALPSPFLLAWAMFLSAAGVLAFAYGAGGSLARADSMRGWGASLG